MRHTAVTLAAIVALQPVSLFAAPDSPKHAGSELVAVLIDDQSGEELRDQGIQPLEVSDLDALLNAVIQGQHPAKLLHLAVDEYAADNPVSSMEFRPYAGGTPPQAPPPTLPLRQLAEEMKRYRKERAVWQQGVLGYRKQVVTEVEGFIRQVVMSQMAVAQSFDRQLAARNGRDFNRSDIVGCVEAASRLLAEAPRPVIVFNSDCVDQPANRNPQKQPLAAAQLDPRVRLIFVNTSRKPERSILFQGLKNDVRHAESMAAAMEILVGMLDEAEPGTASPNQSQSSANK
jgi:hypothetical protein